MHTLQSKRDGFKLVLPDTFLVPEIIEKYTPVLTSKKHFVFKPIDFINETIQKVQVFGFNNAAIEQQQQTTGGPIRSSWRVNENYIPTGGSGFQYRNPLSPISLTDRTLNIEFRHTLGYLNYFMLLENFIYLYCRDTKTGNMFKNIDIDIFNERGEVYSKIVLMDPIINGMDMLDFDYTQPIAQSGTFKVEFKYSNFDYQFITQKDENSTADISLLSI